jgi:ribosomal 50S subunit-recycling heat shock protein
MLRLLTELLKTRVVRHQMIHKGRLSVMRAISYQPSRSITAANLQVTDSR